MTYDGGRDPLSGDPAAGAAGAGGHPERAHVVAGAGVVARLPHDRFLPSRPSWLAPDGRAGGDASSALHAADRPSCSMSWSTTVTAPAVVFCHCVVVDAGRATRAQRTEAGHAQDRRLAGAVRQRQRGREHAAVALHDLAVLDLARGDRGVGRSAPATEPSLIFALVTASVGEVAVADVAGADLRGRDRVIRQIAVADRAAADLRARSRRRWRDRRCRRSRRGSAGR